MDDSRWLDLVDPDDASAVATASDESRRGAYVTTEPFDLDLTRLGGEQPGATVLIKAPDGSGSRVKLVVSPDGRPRIHLDQAAIAGNYMVKGNWNLGLNINMTSGKPLTPMAANPNYDSEGEIPVAARGTGIQTVDGFKTRTPFESAIDFQTSYSFRLSGARKLTLLADIFNLLNERRVLSYDQNTQLTYPNTNPDFGKPVNSLLGGTPPQFQAPINIRIGVRVQF